MWINFHTHNAFTGADKKFRISRISLFYFAPAAFADIDKKCVINNSAVLTGCISLECHLDTPHPLPATLGQNKSVNRSA